MQKEWYLPTTVGLRVLWLKNFATKLVNYATKYGITAAELTNNQQGAASYEYWVNYRNQYQEYQKKLTAWLLEIASGNTASLPPAPPTLPAPPPAVASGIISRALYLAQRIKTHKDYTVADGQDLGLEGALTAGKTADLKPMIAVKAGTGGHPTIFWDKQAMDGLEIWKDSGNGTWALLDIDLTPDYTDTTTLPAAGATWRYKAIYREDSQQYGQWSDVVSVSVGA